MSNPDPSDPRRTLPSVRALLEGEPLVAAREQFAHEALVEAARTALTRAREALERGETPTVTPATVLEELNRSMRPRLRRVINATGVLLHTNLGRAPLAEAAIAALRETTGYTNLELRLESGERGGRDDGVDAHVRALTGAESAFAVNNCAAATLLALSTLAAGREVIVSRGELVEIGGGFRVPDVLKQSGCRLVEVGTTNRTRVSDYEAAFTSDTAAILRVHRSNFAIVGFTEDAPLESLSSLARERKVPLLFDQGTGELAVVAEALRQGCDLVTFSGDKMLGGPQAGIVAGSTALVERLRRHPLARALRLDKLRFAALEATLALWRSGARQGIPVARTLAQSADTVRNRAQALLDAVGASRCSLVPTNGAAGGGTRPDQQIESWGVRVDAAKPEQLLGILREGEPPVVARIADDAVVLDLYAVPDADVPTLARAVVAGLARLG